MEGHWDSSLGSDPRTHEIDHDQQRLTRRPGPAGVEEQYRPVGGRHRVEVFSLADFSDAVAVHQRPFLKAALERPAGAHPPGVSVFREEYTLTSPHVVAPRIVRGHPCQLALDADELG